MTKHDERRDELRADRALHGLNPSEERELARLANGEEDDSFEAAAAAVALAELGPLEPMPAALAARIEADALARGALAAPVASGKSTTAAGAQVVVVPLPEAPRRDVARWAGWFAAAACAALLVGQVARAPRVAPSSASSAPAPIDSQRSELASRAGARRGAATGARAAGDVVWSDADRRGFLRVTGLAPNDARASQYQLWIVDDARDARYAVNCGTFDVSSAETIVAIAPTLPVSRASAIVVTRESAGGVVVSERGDHDVLVIAIDR